MEWIFISYGLILLVLTIVWVILPFAVFGINKRLDRTNEKLDRLIALQEAKEAGNRPFSS